MKQLPKIDLHCHLDGSVRVETVFELLHKYGLPIPAKTIQELKEHLVAPLNCDSLLTYLKRFDLPISIMQTEEALKRITYELMEDNAKENTKYLEIRFAPLSHTNGGLSLQQVIGSVIAGIRLAEATFDIRANLILSYHRNIDEKDLYSVIDAGSQFVNKGLVALDLCGNENSGFCSRYIPFFDYARSLGYAVTIHAGETGFANNVEDAVVMLKADRIGHGVAVHNKEAIKALLKLKDVTLEVCPTSNIQTKAFSSYKNHPIDSLKKEGMKISIGTDNRTVSDTSMSKEFQILRDIFAWDNQDFADIYRDSIKAAFADKEVKKWLESFCL
jgi:adenosine deaminase